MSTSTIVRGCFRTAHRAQQVQASLSNNSSNNFESHVGVDAEDMDSLRSAFQDCDRVMAVTPLDHTAGFERDAAKSMNII